MRDRLHFFRSLPLTSEVIHRHQTTLLKTIVCIRYTTQLKTEFGPAFSSNLYLISIFRSLVLVTFRVSRRRREMYCGHARLCECLCVCLSVRGRMPTLLHGHGCNLGSGRGCPLVVHYWADLQSVHGLRCYGNTRNAWQSSAVIRQAHRTPHALRMPAKTPLASDKIDAPAACATLSATRPFLFVHTAGVL